MADLERIAPPVPTLPTPVGRNVSSRRRPPPERRPPSGKSESGTSTPAPSHPSTTDHIDEYV